jgi:excisionase family DNA binding protein
MTQLLTINEVGKALGVSRSTVYRIIWDGDLETVHIRQSVRISHEELMRYLNSLSSEKE